MDQRERAAKLNELASLKTRVAKIEADLHESAPPHAWVPRGYYTTYHIMAGMVLGTVAAGASLLFNVIGSAMIGQHPLHLIRVYLTFPMGESALHVESGFALAAGCCLYLMTGMVGGIPFHMIMTRFFDNAPFGVKFCAATVMGVGIWLINFYGVLSWLQPLLIKGDWVVRMIPWWVAVSTHVVFGWTMLLVGQWGRFVKPEADPKERAAC